MAQSQAGAAVKQQVEEGRKAVALGPVDGLTDEELLEQYGTFMRRIVRDVARMCTVRDNRVIEDMAADARLGLLSARRVYQPQGATRFSTYAYYRVKGAVVDGLRKSGHLRRRSRARVDLSAAATLLREAEAEAASARPDYTLRLAHVDRTVLSTGAAWMLVQTTAVRAEQDELEIRPGGIFLRAESAELLTECLQELPEQERTLLVEVYYEERSLTQVGEDRGLSRSWMCRLHARALGRLGEMMKDRQ